MGVALMGRSQLWRARPSWPFDWARARMAANRGRLAVTVYRSI